MKTKPENIYYQIRNGMILFLAMLGVVAPLALRGQDNTGTDFWVMFGRNFSGSGNVLYLSLTSGVNTSGVVSGPSFTSIPFSITANTSTTVIVPASLAVHTNDVVGSNGIHITALHNITVSGLNYNSGSAGAYLALPTGALGTHYIVMTYPSGSNQNNAGSFGLVGTVNGTAVTITPTATTLTHTAGVPYTIMLNQGSTYELRNASGTSFDLTGTIISASQPIGVFGMHSGAAVPTNCAYVDHLCEMLPPTKAWGTRFFTVPYLRTVQEGEYIRILARDNATAVSINGVMQSPLNTGQAMWWFASEQAMIESDKPILVAQFSIGANCAGNPGDPSMMLVTPLEQYMQNYTITTPQASVFGHHYINVVVPDATVGTITRNGTLIAPETFTPIGSTGFSGAHIKVNPGSHTLSASAPFGCFIYGSDSYRAYSYPGGQSVSPAGHSANLILTAEEISGAACTNLCWNALVTDQNSLPVPGIRVDFKIQGVSSDNSGFAFTDASGVAHFCYTGFEGLDSIIASAGSARDTSLFVWSPTASLGMPAVSSNSPMCSGGTLSLSASAPGATSYYWKGPGYFTASVSNPFVANVTVAHSGSYKVIVNNCRSVTTGVIIHETPATQHITSNSPVCEGSPLELSFNNYCIPPRATSPCHGPVVWVISTGGSTNISKSIDRSSCTVLSPRLIDYSDSLGAVIAPGGVLTLNLYFPGAVLMTNVWIDYNDDGNFSEQERVIKKAIQFKNHPFTSLQVVTFNVAAIPGTHRMRIRASSQILPDDACEAGVLAGAYDAAQIDALDFYLTISGTNPISWQWTGPNGFTSTHQVPAPIAATTASVGIYTVTATSPQGCSSTSSTTVLVRTPLSGVYTINSSLPTSGLNFSSFSDVSERLKCGVSGPVVFNVDPSSGPYNEQVVFTDVPGVSNVNTITFNGNGRELLFNAEATGDPYMGRAQELPNTLELKGSDFMRFSNLIISANATTFGLACHLWNVADNNIFTDCTIQCAQLNGPGGGYKVPVSIGGQSNNINGGYPVSNNNIFNGCTIRGGTFGVTINGSLNPPTLAVGNQVVNCTIQDFGEIGISCSDIAGSILSGNTIERPTRTNFNEFIGIALYNGVSDLLCEKNRIRHPYLAVSNWPGSAIGIADQNTWGNNNRYVNNVISDFNCTGTQQGINLSGNAAGTKVYHNTICLNAASSSYSATWGIINGNSQGADIRNNLIDIRRNGPSVNALILYGYYPMPTYIFNHNNLFLNATGGTNYFAINGYANLTYSTLSSWQSTGYDLNSISVEPGYNNPASGDFRPTNLAMNNTGTPLGVLTDITGQIRNSLTPDPGAFEMETCSLTVNAGPDESTFFGYSGDQQVTRTATVTGGTSPFTYNWTVGRALSCNTVTSAGDEVFTGGTCVHTVCPTSGTLSGIASCSGSATVTVRLIDTTDVCVTVSDANNCTATDCFTVNAIDARCFAGNSQVSKVYVCHYTGNNNNPWVQICIDDDAVSAHLANNSFDYLGHCNARYAATVGESSGHLNVYPNPAKNVILMEISGISGKAKFWIINTLGQDVISESIELTGTDNFTVDVSSLVPGIYKMILLNDLGLSEGMFMKE